MQKAATEFAYRNMDFDSVDQKLDFFEQKIHVNSIRKYISQDIERLLLPRVFNYRHTLKCANMLTKACLNTQAIQLFPGMYGSPYTKVIKRLLSSLAFIDKSDPDAKAQDYNKYFKPEHLSDYWVNCETIVSEMLEANKEYEAKDVLTLFAHNLREVAQIFHPWHLAYDGTIIKHSSKIGTHLESILLLPKDPKDAVAYLHGDKIRPLYTEYAEAESAETVVQKYYGTDGLYAQHYRTFLNCSKQYPDQKSALQM